MICLTVLLNTHLTFETALSDGKQFHYACFTDVETDLEKVRSFRSPGADQ